MNVDVDDVVGLISYELDLDGGDIGAGSEADEVENWDSLAHLRLCMAIESKYGVRIPFETVPELTSVKAIVAFLAAS